ncbi:potassium voltage-gated channel subfamily H member 2-like [Watersipora subatra]|uniref:potassium voltage-gated channel subfamily H member 2-like n=1 Tax=Watersipora subatra TaxID=2589382 RepID=UPI00355B249D
MPVKKGHVAPQNTFIETIIRKFDGQHRNFLIANAQVENTPIIFCNEGFCILSGYSRAEVMQKSCVCEFMQGPQTNRHMVIKLRESLTGNTEKLIQLILYRKDGEKFPCSLLLAPVKNERSEIIMFILNFEDMTEASKKPRNGISAEGNLLRKMLPKRRKKLKLENGDPEKTQENGKKSKKETGEESTEEDSHEMTVLAESSNNNKPMSEPTADLIVPSDLSTLSSHTPSHDSGEMTKRNSRLSPPIYRNSCAENEQDTAELQCHDLPHYAESLPTAERFQKDQRSRSLTAPATFP